MLENETQNTLRDRLEANFTASDEGTLNQALSATPISEISEAVETPSQESQRDRDEQGRFKGKQEDELIQSSANQEDQATIVPIDPVPTISRPTTWKKEYLGMWDKLATGLPLTTEESRKLAEYNSQREKEYATGVSTYKAEAQNAKNLQEAMAPFIPSLQQSNIDPATWIKNLGNAHQYLVNGSPEQKIQMFQKLAQDYGVPLGAVQQGDQLDPVVPQLMEYIQKLESKVNTVTGWKESQEQQSLQQQISKFNDAAKYPHFEQVRGTMAQLLESGLAQDLDRAYEKAIRMDDSVWSAEQERQANAIAAKQAADKQAAVSKAKATAVSVKSTTPSGKTASLEPKDRRSLIAAKFDAISNGGRV